MSGATIGYDVTDPADSKNLGLGAGDIRSYKTNMQGGLAAEHLWPAAGGYSGVHLAGSARVFVGTSSQVSSADTTGRLMLDSTNSRLWNVGSDASYPLGGRYVPESSPYLRIRASASASTFTSALTQIWAMEVGVGTVKVGSLTTTVTLQNTYVRFLPVVSGAGNIQYAFHPHVSPSGSISGGLTGNTMVVASISEAGVNDAPVSDMEFTYMVMGFKAI